MNAGRLTRAQEGCRFCGRREPLTREHVLAKWVRPLIEEGPPAPYVYRSEAGTERIWEAPLASLTVKRVCRTCNGGWMNDLERAVKPILTGRVRGTPRTLSQAELAVLSAWGAKTTMAYDLTRAEPMVPAEHRRWLAQHGAPPPGTAVLVARYAGQRFPLFSAHGGHTFDIRVGSQPRQKWGAYMTSASIGPVVLQLFGHGMTNVVGCAQGPGRQISRK